MNAHASPVAPPHALTVDVEESFHSEDSRISRWDRHPAHAESSVRALLDLCAAAGAQGTFFVLGWVAERHPGLVRAIAAHGHEIASHGQNHQFVYRQERRAFLEDVRRSRDVLEQQVGRPVIGYRAPYFSIVRESLWAYECLAEAGYDYSSSVFPGRNPRYGIPGHSQDAVRVETRSGPITEHPITTFFSRVGCGGVYFRALPYRWFSSRLSSLERAGRRAVFYVHPWELEPDASGAAGSASTRLRHAIGRGGARARMARLLAEHRFAPLEAGVTAS